MMTTTTTAAVIMSKDKCKWIQKAPIRHPYRLSFLSADIWFAHGVHTIGVDRKTEKKISIILVTTSHWLYNSFPSISFREFQLNKMENNVMRMHISLAWVVHCMRASWHFVDNDELLRENAWYTSTMLIVIGKQLKTFFFLSSLCHDNSDCFLCLFLH